MSTAGGQNEPPTACGKPLYPPDAGYEYKLVRLPRDPTPTTKRGFIKAHLLTLDQLERIIEHVEAGVWDGEAARKEGTSVVQLIRRLKKEDVLRKRYDKARRKIKRDPNVESQSWRKNPPQSPAKDSPGPTT